MQDTSSSKKQLFALTILILFVGIFLFISIKQYRNTFYSNQKNEQTDIVSLDVIPISANDPINGNYAAPITIIGFEDFLCDGCRQQYRLISDVLAEYPNQVKFIWKDFSIVTVPQDSNTIHRYGYCLHQQDLFAEFQEIIFNNFATVSESQLQTISAELGAKERPLQTCINSTEPDEHIEKNKLLARALNIQRAPTFFVNGKQIQTPESVAEWKAVLQLN